MLLDSGYIKSQAARLGFTLCGIAASRPLSEYAGYYSQWLERGYDSTLSYLRRNAAKRFDPGILLEGARTIVCCAVHYKNEASQCASRPVPGKVASYAYYRDYHDVFREKLGELLLAVTERYPRVKGRTFADATPLLEKAWAVEAGLGWIGKNTLLVNPRYGSFLLLGEIIMDAGCDVYDKPVQQEKCGNCTKCVDNCPSGALRGPRCLDTARCISRFTTERSPEDGAMPPGGLNGWVFGCDECQGCCPYNRRAPLASPGILPRMIPPEGTGPAFWRENSCREMEELYGETPLARFGFQVLKDRMDQK